MRLSNHWEKGLSNHHHSLDGVRAIYINSMIRNLAGSISGIFLPLYIYQWGVASGGMAYGLMITSFMVLLERGLICLSSIALGRVVSKLGYKWSVMASSVLMSLYYYVAAQFGMSIATIILLSILASILTPLYWLPRLSMLSGDGQIEEMGSEVGMVQLTEKISSVLGPLLGGIILGFFGFRYLFVLVSVLSVFSSIPIFFVKNYLIADGISLGGFFRWLKDGANRHLVISFWGQGWANMVDACYWPIYLYLVVGSFTLMGGLSTITFAISALMTVVAGKLFDRLRKKRGSEDEREYGLSTAVVAGMQMLRPIFRNVWSLFSLDSLFSVAIPFWSIDYDSYLFAAGKRSGRSLVFYTYREIWYSFSRFVGGSILFMMFYFGLGSWWVIFGMGALGTLLTVGMQKES